MKRYGVGVRWGVIAVILCACMLVPAGQASTADVTVFSTNPAWVANSGWQYSFRVTVRNTGSDAVHVVLRETLDPRERMDWNFLENHGSSPVCTSTPTIDCDLGMLDPGASATVLFEAQVDGTAPGTVTHTASVDGGANETSSMPVRERSTTDLNVFTQDAAGASFPDWNAYAVWLVEQAGPANASDVKFHVDIPAGVKVVFFQSTQGTCDAVTATCDLGFVSGTSPQITLRVLAGLGQALDLRASATTSSVDPDMSNNVSTAHVVACCVAYPPPPGPPAPPGSPPPPAPAPFTFGVPALGHTMALSPAPFDAVIVSGGSGSYAGSVHSGVMPGGVVFRDDGHLAGVARYAGTYTFSLDIHDSTGAYALSPAFTLVVDRSNLTVPTTGTDSTVSLRGQVSFAGHGVAGARVTVGKHAAMTTKTGSFTLRELAPGNVLLVVTKRGYRTVRVVVRTGHAVRIVLRR